MFIRTALVALSTRTLSIATWEFYFILVSVALSPITGIMVSLTFLLYSIYKLHFVSKDNLFPGFFTSGVFSEPCTAPGDLCVKVVCTFIVILSYFFFSIH